MEIGKGARVWHIISKPSSLYPNKFVSKCGRLVDPNTLKLITEKRFIHLQDKCQYCWRKLKLLNS